MLGVLLLTHITGGDTPIEELELPAGLYKVLLVNPQRKLSRTVKIKIHAGKSVRWAVTFDYK